MLWLSAGVLLYLLQAGRISSSNLLTVSGFFVVCWVYLNFLSERWRYGDYSYYLDAARNLYLNQPLPATYFYPPLWATLLQFLVPAGEDTFFIVLWLLDFASFVAFYFLLHRVLERYGFTARLAAVVTTVFMLANAPLLRTLVYVQVNLHTLDLILLALLLYPKRLFLSALMLALAVHLKGSPAIVVLAFLLEKDWRWLGWFVLSLALVAGSHRPHRRVLAVSRRPAALAGPAALRQHDLSRHVLRFVPALRRPSAAHRLVLDAGHDLCGQGVAHRRDHRRDDRLGAQPRILQWHRARVIGC